MYKISAAHPQFKSIAYLPFLQQYLLSYHIFFIPISCSFILSFAAILFIAHIWPPGRDETCKRGKAERHVKHIKHLLSLGNVKHIKHPPSLGKQYLAPPVSRAPSGPHLRSGKQIFTCSTPTSFPLRRRRIYICLPAHIHLAPSSIAIIRRPLLPWKAHSSSAPVFHRQGGGAGGSNEGRGTCGGAGPAHGGVRGHLTTRHRHPLTRPICS